VKVRIDFLFACLAALATPALAQERVLGLLALPQVFGRGACDRFTPQPVPLRADPRGAVIGAIVVATPWTFQGDGGCSGLEIAVRMNGTTTASSLPTREYGYEEPGAIVVDARDGWYKVRLATGSAWVPSSGAEFYSLERLYRDSLTYLSEHWEGRLFEMPANAGRAVRISRSDEPIVRVQRSSRIKGSQWFLVEVMSHSLCTGDGEPTVVDRGWVPAHGTSGEPSIWFYSRGC
jgi:hypothetical protein